MGPYAAQQILLYAVRPLVAAEALRCKDLRTGLLERSEDGFDETLEGPANTWPLGEILVARHDLQHSRIFNS
jgi:urease accessory protein